MKKEYVKPEMEIITFETENMMEPSAINPVKDGDGFGDWGW